MKRQNVGEVCGKNILFLLNVDMLKDKGVSIFLGELRCVILHTLKLSI